MRKFLQAGNALIKGLGEGVTTMRRCRNQRYLCRICGISIVPSSFWKFSMIATIVRPTASEEPLRVCASTFFFPSL